MPIIAKENNSQHHCRNVNTLWPPAVPSEEAVSSIGDFNLQNR